MPPFSELTMMVSQQHSSEKFAFHEIELRAISDPRLRQNRESALLPFSAF